MKTSIFWISIIVLALILLVDIKRAGAWGDPTPQPNIQFVTDNFDTHLLEFAGSAEKSLYVAAYSLSYRPFVDLLKAKHAGDEENEGILVYVVMDSEPEANLPVIIELRRAGIRVVVNQSAEEPTPRMHHKFVVRDGQAVLMGSTNFTYHDLVVNTGSMWIIDDSFYYGIVTAFNCEFYQMLDGKFGWDKKDCSTRVDIGGSLVHIKFSPHSNLENIAQTLVTGSSHTMIETNWLTLDGLASTLMGVENLAIIYPEDSYGAEHDHVHTLTHADIRLADDLHAKAMATMRDGRGSLMAGSANLSNGAEDRNDESIIVVTGGRLGLDLYLQYREYFYSVR
jgi:phosphatidylserine/phosphatidylglycerophosphate/cardiolipin synthase-like enzyme